MRENEFFSKFEREVAEHAGRQTRIVKLARS